MSIPKWLVPAALGLALLLGWLYWRSSVADAVKHAQMEAHSDSLDRALGLLRTHDQAQADSVALLLKRGALVKLRIDTLLVRSTVAESVFVSTIPDSLRDGFERVLAIRDSLEAGYRSQITDLAAALDVQTRRIAPFQEAVAALTKDRDAWRKAAKPPFLKRLVSRVPSLALGAVIVLVIHGL